MAFTANLQHRRFCIKYQLGSSANVSIVKQALVKKELIEIEKRQVVIPITIMEVWLKRELGMQQRGKC